MTEAISNTKDKLQKYLDESNEYQRELVLSFVETLFGPVPATDS